MAENFVFAYRVTSDTGFAPCVTEDLLTLACCKGGRKPHTSGKDFIQTGLRYWIGTGRTDKNEIIDPVNDRVFVMGIYRGKLLYCAEVTSSSTMEEYFTVHHDRKDCIYSFSVKNNRLYRNNRFSKIHPKKDHDQINRDLSGKYVVCSEKGHFAYFGKNCIEIKNEYKGFNYPANHGTKTLVGTEADSLAEWFDELIDEQKGKPIPAPNKPFAVCCVTKKCSV